MWSEILLEKIIKKLFFKNNIVRVFLLVCCYMKEDKGKWGYVFDLLERVIIV